MSEDSGAVNASIAVEIDRDIDLQLTKHPCDLGVIKGLRVDETVERGFDPPTQFAPVIGA